MSPGTELWLFAVSLFASALGGMLGMASGIFIVPILTMFGHVEIHSAVGASIVSVIGAVIGARVLMAVSNEKIRLLFVVALIALAVQMFLGAFGIDLIRRTE